MRSLGLLFAGIAAAGSLCAIGYYASCILAAREFLREGRRSVAGEASSLPPVSILKPLKGIDPELYESLRSHCLQDYPYRRYEIIFGVSAMDDPAVPLVEHLKREFPAAHMKLVLCSEPLGTNRKVGNLAQMLAQSRYSHVIVNDSDIRVSRQYLRNILSPFASAKVGMVTAPYVGVPGAGLWSRVEALGIATDFMPGVLAARRLEGGLRFGLGSTLAMSRAALDAIGGFLPLIDYLGDDYELGSRIARAGYSLVLSHEVVQTFLPAYTFRGFFQHQLRWSRAVRDSRKGGFFGLVFTFGIFWGLLAMLFAHAAVWSLLLLAATVILRLWMADVVSVRVLHEARPGRTLWLVPLRDLIAVAVWVGALFGNTIVWRGERFHLQHGRLRRFREEGV